MNDYLGTLIGRHQQTQIGIQPRLGSLFERAPGIGDFAGAIVSDSLLAASTFETPTPRPMFDDGADLLLRFNHPAAHRQHPQAPPVAEMAASVTPLSREAARSTGMVQPIVNDRPQPDIAISQEEHFQRIRRTVTPDVEQQTEPLPVRLASFTVLQSPLPLGQPETNRSQQSNILNAPDEILMKPESQPVRSIPSQSLATQVQPAGQATQPAARIESWGDQAGITEQASSVLSGFHKPDKATMVVPLLETALLPKPRLFTRPAEVAIAPRLPGSPLLTIAAKAEPPVIKVTIGRIEVRATMPPPLAPRVRGDGGRTTPVSQTGAPKPALSLADYLKERGNSR